jgi:hypothetical protein
MANDVEIVVRTTDRSQAGIESSVAGHNRLRGAISNVAATAAGFVAANIFGKLASQVKDFISGSVEAYSGLNESLNAVNVTYGSSAAKILEWGKANATAFGLSQRAFNETAVPLGAMLKNAGLGMDTVTDSTIKLTKRASDLASVFNTSLDDALDAIKSGLRGEADPLERYGVGLSAVKVEAEALSETHKKSAKDLTDQEKMMARMNLIFKQTAATEGDFKNTSDGLANSQRILAAKTEEAQAKLGEKLQPVVLKVTEAKLKLVGVIADKLMPQLDKIAGWMKAHPDAIKVFAGVVGTMLVMAFMAWAASAASAAAATLAATWPVLAIMAAIALLVAGVIYAYTHWKWFREAVKAVADFFTQTLWPALQSIGAWFAGPFADFWISAWHKVSAAWNAVYGFFSDMYRYVYDITFAVTSSIVRAWTTVINFVTGLPGRISAIASGMWNGITSAFRSAINSIIRMWNGLHFSIPSISIPGIGTVGGNTVHVPQLPYMATGGISPGGITAVGERGIELLDLPAGTHVRSNADTGRVLGNATPAGTARLELGSDGSAFGDLLIQLIAKMVRAQGGDPALLGIRIA